MIIRYILAAILLGIVLYPVSRILTKTGHSPWLVISFLIPFVNVAMLYILAQGKWPIEYERDALVEENEKLKDKCQQPLAPVL
jgi:predicted PurR-regulated permease PerM